MDFGLEGKKALVTGSTGGIGYAIAKALAHEGATVYINGRTQDRVQEAIKNLKKENVKGTLLPAAIDLTSLSGVKQLFTEIPSVDILVNNIGIYEHKAFEAITDEDWLHYFEINVLSGIRLSRHYFPLMKEKNWGRIVFISSESGVNIPPEMIHYGVTKTAQLSVARGLAELTKGTGVTVNSVLPGPTASEGVRAFVEAIAKEKGISYEQAEKKLLQELRPTTLLERLATGDEVGALVAFVCSTHASATNGAALRVDGGVVRSIT